jgi:isocitrate lyase
MINTRVHRLVIYAGSSGHTSRGPTPRGKEGKTPLCLPYSLHAHHGVQCGHLSGKVVVPTSAHISRLVASRFQLDLLQHTMLLIARTDAESARLISSTVDARDHAYIRGVRTRLPDGSHRPALAEVLDRAEAEGRSGAEIDNLEANWLSEVELTTFDQGKPSFRAELFFLQADETRVAAVEQAIQESGNVPSHQKAFALERYREAAAGKSNTEARNIAADILGSQLDWDWDRASFFAVRFLYLFDVNIGKHSAADPRGILPYYRWN